ncbi:AraC family transcriptional regulator [Pseudomonas sp. RW3S2]|uniref:AraC family transcriptional regulator n=1 Tax=Pseudomonas sp. RW3S2 TaxID=485884 RepID=UPI00320973D0
MGCQHHQDLFHTEHASGSSWAARLSPCVSVGGPGLADVPSGDFHNVSQVRYGQTQGPADMCSLGGSFAFDDTDPALLIALLPTVVHVRSSVRLSQLVQMVSEESVEQKPGSEFALSRLVELLLIEAMRLVAIENAPVELLRGLADGRLAPVLNQLHARIDHPWSVDQLASIAALSRSAFFERFTRTVGVAPMAHLLAWRMEVAKQLLRARQLSVAEIAERVGYGSASAFSVAFSKHAGQSPSRFRLPEQIR